MIVPASNLRQTTSPVSAEQPTPENLLMAAAVQKNVYAQQQAQDAQTNRSRPKAPKAR